MSVFFHSEETNFKLSGESKYEHWIIALLQERGFSAGDINVIFTSNDFLLGINQRYLNHNYFTDVITFDYSEGKNISGDIYISVVQVAVNAREYKDTFTRELARVIIHGVLHLIGFNDSNITEKREIRRMEDDALKRLDL